MKRVIILEGLLYIIIMSVMMTGVQTAILEEPPTSGKFFYTQLYE